MDLQIFFSDSVKLSVQSLIECLRVVCKDFMKNSLVFLLLPCVSCIISHCQIHCQGDSGQNFLLRVL